MTEIVALHGHAFSVTVRAMVILGIDPGSTVTGFGAVRRERGRLVLVDCGAVRTKSSTPMPMRLAAIYDGLSSAIARIEPDAIAIESIFSHKSSISALKLGQARGVALLTIAQAGHEAHEYNPMTIKQSVGATGRADKAGVARMVKMLLGVDIPGPSDISDALAIAITHHAHAGLRARMVAR